jgi:hypothetical protein
VGFASEDGCPPPGGRVRLRGRPPPGLRGCSPGAACGRAGRSAQSCQPAPRRRAPLGRASGSMRAGRVLGGAHQLVGWREAR